MQQPCPSQINQRPYTATHIHISENWKKFCLLSQSIRLARTTLFTKQNWMRNRCRVLGKRLLNICFSLSFTVSKMQKTYLHKLRGRKKYIQIQIQIYLKWQKHLVLFSLSASQMQLIELSLGFIEWRVTANVDSNLSQLSGGDLPLLIRSEDYHSSY